MSVFIVCRLVPGELLRWSVVNELLRREEVLSVSPGSTEHVFCIEKCIQCSAIVLFQAISYAARPQVGLALTFF